MACNGGTKRKMIVVVAVTSVTMPMASGETTRVMWEMRWWRLDDEED